MTRMRWDDVLMLGLVGWLMELGQVLAAALVVGAVMLVRLFPRRVR